ncbi:MAG: MBL fold metallo-hydrolase [Candidatus Heimdallarchaeota archaeon]|nr:MBL fold metallo-hydrolase [Candidatus Heimdallarchaeota archaeon]
MIIGFIGARGTVPTADIGTVSFLVDNKYLFECPSEIVQSFQRFQKQWQMIDFSNSKIIALGKPSFGRIRYIILSHLHYDHWGGLPHIIHRILLFEREKRLNEPLRIIIPKGSTIPFQRRASEVFNNFCSSFLLDDAEFLYRLLTIEVGDETRKVIEITTMEEGQTINLDSNYSLSAIKNKHLNEGSFAYNLTFKVTKLNVDKAKSLNIPFDHTLREIEKSEGDFYINNQKINRNDIFYENCIKLSYSGDTPIDPDLFQFFKSTDVLIHELTYLSTNENYHLDFHSDIEPLIKLLKNLRNLRVFIPIHFSIRYTEQEIIEKLSSTQVSINISSPLENIVLLIEPDKVITYARL